MGALKSILIIIAIFILFAVILTLSFVLYKTYFITTQEFTFLPDNSGKSDINISLGPNPSESFPNGIIFYDNLRFRTKNISYTISPDCDSKKINDSLSAFEILQNYTILNFHEVNTNGEVNVYCSDEVKGLTNKYFIAGEGGPDFIINTSNYNIILNGTVLLYRANKCDRPVVVMHEILHVLGFKHTIDKNSILYATSNCNQEITKEVIDEIDYLYKDPSLPDLEFTKLNATKQGVFLNFETEIKNVGLSNAKNVTLTLYAGANFINEYSLGNIDFGEGKIFKVSNRMFLRQPSNLKFIIDYKNTISEIDESNNIANLALAD